MIYQHRYLDGSAVDLPMGKVVCVGRNYAAVVHQAGHLGGAYR